MRKKYLATVVKTYLIFALEVSCLSPIVYYKFPDRILALQHEENTEILLPVISV